MRKDAISIQKTLDWEGPGGEGLYLTQTHGYLTDQYRHSLRLMATIQTTPYGKDLLKFLISSYSADFIITVSLNQSVPDHITLNSLDFARILYLLI